MSAQHIAILGVQEHRIIHEELCNEAMKLLAGVISHSERIMIATFQGNPATSVIVKYALTNASKMEIVEGYCADLRRAIESLPVHNILVILGDFNVKLGPHAMPPTQTMKNTQKR